MQPSDNFFPFLAHWEGLVLHPYLDKAGVPTIGYGSTYYENGDKVKMSDPSISIERAKSLAKITLRSFVGEVNALAPTLNQNQFDAILDFAYNEGSGALRSSTLLKRIKAGSSEELIRDAFMMWVKVKNPKTGQLETDDWQVKRRKGEADLYFKPVS